MYLASKGFPLQPFVLVIGPELNDLTGYYVVLNEDTWYTVNSITAAFDVTFKCLWALNVNYPHDCVQCWYVIQKNCYDLDYNYRDFHCNTRGLLSRLTPKKK